MDKELDELNHHFAIGDRLRFVRERGDLIEAVVRTPTAHARVALQGAQLLHWQPVVDSGIADLPVIWTSKQALFEPGKPVRGGIPVCWPWFGDHPGNLPAHGFARNRVWQVEKSAEDGDNIILRFALEDDAWTRTQWPHAFRLALTLTIGERLDLLLETENRDKQSFSLTQGLHTYLHVSDIDAITVRGLEGYYYLDKLKGMSREYQDDVLRFSGETDRVFLGTNSDIVVDDPEANRRLIIGKRGSHSTVVWTPWADKAESFADMAREEYEQMLCVEATNAGDDIVSVQPDQVRRLGTSIRVRPLD